MAWLMLHRNRFEEAIHFSERALRSDPEGPWQINRPAWCTVRGSAAFALGNQDEADIWLARALELNQRAGPSYALGSSSVNYASIFVQHGQRDKALRLYEEAIEIFRIFSSPVGIANSRIHITDIYNAQNQHGLALEAATLSADVLRRYGMYRRLAVALFVKARALDALAAVAEAEETFAEVRRLAMEGQNHWLASKTPGEQSFLAMRSRDPEAEAMFATARRELEANNHVSGLFTLLSRRIETEHRLQNREKTHAHLEEAETLARRHNMIDTLNRIAAFRKQLAASNGSR